MQTKELLRLLKHQSHNSSEDLKKKKRGYGRRDANSNSSNPSNSRSGLLQGLSQARDKRIGLLIKGAAAQEVPNELYFRSVCH